MSYEEFVDEVKTINFIGDAQGLLGWDQEVMMPEGSAKARSLQNSALTQVTHQKMTSDKLGKMIEELETKDLDREQSAVLREVRRAHKRQRKVPEELQRKISEKGTENVEYWRKARKQSDWKVFEQHLQEMVELKRRYAEEIDPEQEPYQVLFEDYEPYLDFEKVEEIMQRLKEELPALIEDIEQSEVELDIEALEKSLGDDKNKELARKTAESIGFDFEYGRIDTSTHPFTSGNQFDTRITTRFAEDSVAENIAISMHETGHGLYQQGLPKEHYGTPLGSSRELTVHESQSRLWENHVGRSKEFWDYFVEEIQEISEEFEDVTPEKCYKASNSVNFDNCIRTEADEISYHLHIVLRFELGRKLINGDIEVEELPELWNEKMEHYLEVQPEDDAEGALQDIHWAWGNFGYFPTYSLGTVLAAQLFRTAEEELGNLEESFKRGEFEPLLNWLRENIHSRGQLLKTDELVQEVTGEELTADYLLEYLESKYSELYRF